VTAEANTATFQQAVQQLNAGEIDAAIDGLFAVDALDHDPAGLMT